MYVMHACDAPEAMRQALHLGLALAKGTPAEQHLVQDDTQREHIHLQAIRTM